jgi:hypothetical protein
MESGPGETGGRRGVGLGGGEKIVKSGQGKKGQEGIRAAKSTQSNPVTTSGLDGDL